jgi:hypothetical protein
MPILLTSPPGIKKAPHHHVALSAYLVTEYYILCFGAQWSLSPTVQHPFPSL